MGCGQCKFHGIGVREWESEGFLGVIWTNVNRVWIYAYEQGRTGEPSPYRGRDRRARESGAG